MTTSTVIQKATNKLLWLYRWLRFGSELQPDETAVLFPQCASQNPAGGWHVPLHAWVVELETGSLSRQIGHAAVMDLFQIAGIVDEDKNDAVFKKRLDWFMADRELNKRLQIKIEDQTFSSPRTAPNGHVKFPVQYDGKAPAGSFVEYNVISNKANPVKGLVQLVPHHGLSVISDIDDTIKISNVTDKKALIKSVFCEEYKASPGMPALYRHLSAHDACFHYVSSSPWQIYPSLEPLLRKYYPAGSISLRHFYVAGRSFVDFFRHSRRYKTNAISDLLNRFPGRDFILIGDSGEKDPEIYCEIAASYGARVKGIFIRQVATPSDDEKRWQQLRRSLPDPGCFRVFTDPATLYKYIDAILDQSKPGSHQGHVA